ncbi:MAG: sulfite exporter TauE/SafE family protein [Oscillospiraceae bacterium]|nr:sulfite exporter TauE/SafE family protein [Oscillospiraceae bacterium]
MQILGILVAFATAALAGMGVGGGGLLVLYLTLALHMEQLSAQGVNMLFFAAASAASLLIHARKRKLDMRVIVICAIFALGGAYGGSLLANAMETGLLRKIFGGFLIFSGVLVFLKKEKSSDSSSAEKGEGRANQKKNKGAQKHS